MDGRGSWAEELARPGSRWRVGVEEGGGAQDAVQVPSSGDGVILLIEIRNTWEGAGVQWSRDTSLISEFPGGGEQ